MNTVLSYRSALEAREVKGGRIGSSKPVLQATKKLITGVWRIGRERGKILHRDEQ